jgi:hypothetical protein
MSPAHLPPQEKKSNKDNDASGHGLEAVPRARAGLPRIECAASADEEEHHSRSTEADKDAPPHRNYATRAGVTAPSHCQHRAPWGMLGPTLGAGPPNDLALTREAVARSRFELQRAAAPRAICARRSARSRSDRAAAGSDQRMRRGARPAECSALLGGACGGS